VFLFRDVVGFVNVDIERLFGDSAEDIEFKRDEIFDELFKSVSDGNDVALFDVSGIVTLEESLGDTGLITDDGIDHFDFLSISGFDFLGFG
jgi:hypothetical protein